ncbi:MAG: hypothetical protein KAU94_05195 [Verrucomicrobia bacterium]|nr:hypothetical protein [Verrucomicrobiota bacterium]
MKMKNKANIWGVLVAASFTASFALAQSGIADEELLKMLDGIATNETAAMVAEPDVQPDVAPVEGVDDVVADPVVVDPVVVDPVVAEDAAAEAGVAEEAAADPVVAEEATADPVLEEAESIVADVDVLGMASLGDGATDASGDLISVRLSKVGLEEAINLFAQLSGANIIVPELTEAAQISVNLKDVEWRPALQSILDAYNYELYQKVSGSNVFSVRRRPVGAPEPQVVETFKLRFATVPNAAALIRELLPEDAKVSEFASRNMIVVKSSESSLSEVRTVLQTIDIVRQQVFIESKFMELNDQAQKDLGIDWQVLQSYGLGTRGATDYRYGNATTRDEQNNSFSGLNGTPYNEGSSYGETPGAIPGDVLSGLTPTKALAETDITTQILTSVLDADEFRLMMSALEENQGVNVVSNPKIIVANEELATISIIRKEPNLKQDRQQSLNDQPDTITYTLDPDLQFFEFGIKLDVVPSINTSSNITVKIVPSLTRKVGEKKDNTQDNDLISYPIIDEKTIETVFNLASGQTAAIGGLTEVEDSDIERKVPLLGSIPFLGRLFSWQQTIHSQKETVIFVTVALANTQDINAESGIPEDSELARRRIIRDLNAKALREQGRKYYEAEEDDKFDDMLKEIDIKENRRIEKRAKETKVVSS